MSARQARRSTAWPCMSMPAAVHAVEEEAGTPTARPSTRCGAEVALEAEEEGGVSS